MTSKPRTLSSGQNRKTIWIATTILIVVILAGYTYYSKVFLASQTTNSSSVQTAVIRRGDLIVSASGTGTLVAQTDASFGFDTSGQVKEVHVKVGDLVESGQVLAQLDDTLAQMDYAEAEQALRELYSDASIATVQQEIGTAQDTAFQARTWLEYLISPNVVEAEEKVAEAEQKLAEAQAQAKSNPSQAADQAVKDSQSALTYWQQKLNQAWNYYRNTYAPEEFGNYVNIGSRRHPKMVLDTYIDPHTGEELPDINWPSADDIAIARNTLTTAQETIKEDRVYLEVLKTGVIPEGATGAKLSALYDAQLAVENAKEALDETKLVAPISGTVTELSLGIGEHLEKQTASTGSTSTGTTPDVIFFDSAASNSNSSSSSSTITISQLSQPYTLDIFLDEADWDNAKVGNKVTVTFDLLDGQSFPGTVTLVFPVLSESYESPLVHVLVQLDQRISQDLPAGTGADVEVIGAEARGALLVPLDALHETEDGKYTVTVYENRKPVERNVEIGLKNDTYAEVKAGLADRDIVVMK